MTPESRSKLKLIFLLLLTVLPVTMATLAFKSGMDSGLIGGTTNKGTLILPPMDITALDMRDETGDTQFRRFEEMIEGIDAEEYVAQPWLMVFVTAAQCDGSCQDRIHYLKQLHIRLGKNTPRLRRYYLHANAEPIAEDNRQLLRTTYPSMGVAHTSRETLQRNFTEAGLDLDLDEGNYVFLVDPVGNVMMYYTDEDGHEDIFTDLERLLRYSSLG